MGELYHNTGGTTWKLGAPYVRTATGWMPGKYLYRHNGTSWVQIWQQDTTPPAAPSIVLGLPDKRTINVGVTVPAAAHGPIKRVVVKAATNNQAYASSPTDSYGYYSQIDAGGENWSEFWQNKTLTTDTYGVKPFPPPGMSLNYNETVRFSAFIQDEFGNWSTAGTAMITTASADPPPKTLQNFTAYVDAGSSRSWRPLYGNWQSDNNYVYQAGSANYYGFWFYGTALADTLYGAINMLDVDLHVIRLNTSHGVSGQANVTPGVHNLTSQPGGDPTGNAWANTYVGTIGRGESKWLQLPSNFWNGFASGGHRGVALMHGTTAWTSPYYITCYGAGTASGRLFLNWQKYV